MTDQIEEKTEIQPSAWPFWTVVNFPLKDIRVILEEDVPLNPRGVGYQSTDLKESMAEEGQKEPIRGFLNADGKLFVLNGNRRVTAARALKWKTVKAIIQPPGKDDTLLAQLSDMLASNVNQPVSPLHMSNALHKLVSGGMAIHRAARIAGMKPEYAQLLVDLQNAPLSIRNRVDAGEMSMSAWKLIRDQPPAIQEKAGELKKPTKAAVRKVVREEDDKAPTTVIAGALTEGTSTLIVELNALRAKLTTEWGKLTALEQAQVQSVLTQIMIGIGSTLGESK